MVQVMLWLHNTTASLQQEHSLLSIPSKVN